MAGSWERLGMAWAGATEREMQTSDRNARRAFDEDAPRETLKQRLERYDRASGDVITPKRHPF